MRMRRSRRRWQRTTRPAASCPACTALVRCRSRPRRRCGALKQRPLLLRAAFRKLELAHPYLPPAAPAAVPEPAAVRALATLGAGGLRAAREAVLSALRAALGGERALCAARASACVRPSARSRPPPCPSPARTGDALAAEYLLLSLTSRVQGRSGHMVLGTLSLNICGLPDASATPAPALSAVGEAVRATLAALLPKCHVAGLSCQALNSGLLFPSKVCPQATQAVLPPRAADGGGGRARCRCAGLHHEPPAAGHAAAAGGPESGAGRDGDGGRAGSWRGCVAAPRRADLRLAQLNSMGVRNLQAIQRLVSLQQVRARCCCPRRPAAAAATSPSPPALPPALPLLRSGAL